MASREIPEKAARGPFRPSGAAGTRYTLKKPLGNRSRAARKEILMKNRATFLAQSVLWSVLAAWALVPRGGAASDLPSPWDPFFPALAEQIPPGPPEPFAWRRLVPGDDVERLLRDSGFLALCETRSADDVQAALLRGADPNLSSDRGRSALMFAMANPDPSVAQTLLARGADPRAVDREGHPVWMFRTLRTPLRTLELLLDFGLSPFSAGPSGVEMPFLLAAAADASDTLPLILRRGVSVDCRDASGATLLMWAATSASSGGVTTLLRQGADPRARDQEGRSPLHYALESPTPSVPVLRALLRGGADPNARTREGVTPLALAARRGLGEEIFRVLLQGGADPTQRDQEGITPCDEARTHPELRHHREILRLLCGPGF